MSTVPKGPGKRNWLAVAASRQVERFRKDDSAAITVEFVVWLPIFFSVLLLIAEASNLFLTQSVMWNVARDTARNIANLQMNQSAALAYATSAMSPDGHQYTITASATGPDVWVKITVPVQDVLTFSSSPMAAFSGLTLMAKVTLRKEPV